MLTMITSFRFQEGGQFLEKKVLLGKKTLIPRPTKIGSLKKTPTLRSQKKKKNKNKKKKQKQNKINPYLNFLPTRNIMVRPSLIE